MPKEEKKESKPKKKVENTGKEEMKKTLNSDLQEFGSDPE